MEKTGLLLLLVLHISIEQQKQKRCEKKEEFCAHVYAAGLFRHEKVPDLFAERGTAGVLGVHEIGELFLEAFDEGRFARAVAAFKNNKFPACH